MADAGVTVERRFDAPPDLVWALLADTNRYDRALGLGATRYVWREIDGRRQRVGHASQGGLEMSWVEDPYEWIEGRMLRTRRTFLSGPAKAGGLALEVEPDGDGCQVRLTAHGEAKSLVLRMLDPLVRAHLRRRMTAYLDTMATIVERRGPAEASESSLPAAIRVQPLLLHQDDALASGGRTETNQAELERRAARLSRSPVDGDVVERLVQTLAKRPDEEVSQMRPFELARQWGEDRRRVLQVFLHGTRAGLVDLNWQVNCPVCRVSAQVVDGLADVGRDVHCEACNISYDVDFGANVEAVFRCNRAIRDVEPAVYCLASPSFRPHVFAQLQVPAQGEQAREVMLPLHDGRLHVRTLEGGQPPVELEDEHAPAEIDVEIGPDAIEVQTRGHAEDGTTRLRLRSRLDHPTFVLIERRAWTADAVLGSVIASQPDFVDLFATEAPAAGLDLSIGQLTLLFSDLTGSTALYERVGDARAYAIVQEHFRVMEEVIAAHEGAVIKTMGDAVMASFVSPQHAIAAAIDAVRETEARHHAHEIGVKLGVHEGPCLAVRANDRLDFFGTTVNLAARLQGQAGPGELVVLRELAEQPAIGPLLPDGPRRALTARLKGIEDARELVAIDLRPSPG